MTRKRLLLFAGALALALTLGLYAKTAQAVHLHRTNVVINDYVYDTHSINWINVNTYTRGLNCNRASIVLYDMIEEGYAVEFAGPISCPYTISYSVYHGQQVYRPNFNFTYRLRFNQIHTNLWINNTYGYSAQGRRVFRPYYQSTVRVVKPRVQSRQTYSRKYTNKVLHKKKRINRKTQRRHQVSPKSKYNKRRQGASNARPKRNFKSKSKRNNSKRKQHRRVAQRRR